MDLKTAAQTDDIDALYALIRRHPTILKDVDDVPFVDTPSHVAASTGNIRFSMEMMNLYPSFARKLNPDGYTPLHLALHNNQRIMVQWLINADPTLVRVKGREGMTPLHQAVGENNLDALAEFLVGCPECIVDANNKGETALHIAAKIDNEEALKVLLNWLKRNRHKDGDIWQVEVLNSKDNDGNTVLHVAAMNNNTQMIGLLLQHGIVRNHTNLETLTPLDIVTNHPDDTAREAERILQGAGGLKAGALPQQTLLGFLQSDISRSESMYKILVRQRKNLEDNTRNALLVVAGLILTTTYQASLNPPGGFSQGPGKSASSLDNNNTSTHSKKTFDFVNHWITEDNHLGKSVMNTTSFIGFYGLNTISFFLTIMVMIYFLLIGPHLIVALLSSPLISLFFCYTYATLVIAPTYGYSILISIFSLLILSIRFWVIVKNYKRKHNRDGGFRRRY